MDKNLHLSNINGHKKLNLMEVEEIHCCFRGMKCRADALVYSLRGEDVLNKLKDYAETNPERLPDWLQSIEWQLSHIVKETAALLKAAGEAMEKCHSLRGGNETLIKLIEERKAAY